MAEGEQDKGQKSPEDIMKSVLKPLADSIDQLANSQTTLARGQAANQKAIQALANRDPPSMIPKELQALLPDIISGGIDALVSIFSAPSVDPAAAKQGIFGETMQKAFETETISQWKTNSKILEARFEEIDLENKLRRKRLEADY